MAAENDPWGRKPMDPPSVWLRLQTKGESAKIRIAGPPLREVTVWPAEPGNPPVDKQMVANFTSGQWLRIKGHPDYRVAETFALLVIDRADGNAKIMRVSGSVYGKIREFAIDPEWGNPMGYDITITRTEQPGKAYWDVKPSPNKTDLMQSELDKVNALDTQKLLPDAWPANDPQPDDFDRDTTPEDLPWEKTLVPQTAQQDAELRGQAEPKAGVPTTPPHQRHGDVVIEDIDEDKPVNLDDIPF